MNGNGRDPAAGLYLDLLKKTLTGLIYEDPPLGDRTMDELVKTGEPLLKVYGDFDRDKRIAGGDWPSQAHTMVGLRRLDNIQALMEDVLENQVPGDLIETGVWRGGSTIFMRGLLEAYGVKDRVVWVADSFTQFPNRDEVSPRSFTSPCFSAISSGLTDNPGSRELARQIFAELKKGTAYEEVRQTFARYDLLDDQVRFLVGLFSDTLPGAPIERLALLRLDGDLYDSTHDALEALYPKLQPGGYTIVDDYRTFDECREAVADYLGDSLSSVEIKVIDATAVYWKKPLSA